MDSWSFFWLLAWAVAYFAIGYALVATKKVPFALLEATSRYCALEMEYFRRISKSKDVPAEMVETFRRTMEENVKNARRLVETSTKVPPFRHCAAWPAEVAAILKQARRSAKLKRRIRRWDAAFA